MTFNETYGDRCTVGHYHALKYIYDYYISSDFNNTIFYSDIMLDAISYHDYTDGLINHITDNQREASWILVITLRVANHLISEKSFHLKNGILLVKQALDYADGKISKDMLKSIEDLIG